MKHISLIIHLLLCTSYALQAMEEYPQVVVKLDVTVHVPNTHHRDQNHFYNQSLATHFCIKGIAFNNLSMLQHGIEMGANINYANPRTDNLTFIQIACKEQNNDMVKALLKAPHININSYQNGTMPAFHIAGMYRHGKITDLLIAHDSQTINIRNTHGNSLLHRACHIGSTELTNYLLYKGARATIKNNAQKTPLAVAYLESIDFKTFYRQADKKLLLKKDKDGNTQLHLAVLIKDVDAKKFDKYIAFLLTQKLSLWSRNKKNELPIDLAFRKHAEVYKQYSNREQHYSLFNDLIQREKIAHSFLRFTSSKTECVLFKALLEQISSENLQLPKDVTTVIMRMYYALNVETIVARKCKYNTEYYDSFISNKEDFIENKNAIKRQLLANPEPKSLWSA